MASDDAQPVFYYDLGDPHCYLLAEQIMAELPVVPEWEPVHAASLEIELVNGDQARLEQLAAQLGLQSLRWPAAWPPDTRLAALAATYAKQIGRAVAFSLACFRQVFAGGRDLADRDTVLIAAAACEMHPTAVLRALELSSVARALDRAGARASRTNIHQLPAIQLGESVYAGPTALEQALGAIR